MVAGPRDPVPNKGMFSCRLACFPFGQESSGKAQVFRSVRAVQSNISRKLIGIRSHRDKPGRAALVIFEFTPKEIFDPFWAVLPGIFFEKSFAHVFLGDGVDLAVQIIPVGFVLVVAQGRRDVP
jgi:hypothetical protein